MSISTHCTEGKTMMRFAVVKDEFTIAEFSGYRDALEYDMRQTSYNSQCLNIVPIGAAEMPDNIAALCHDVIDQISNSPETEY